MSGKKYHKPTIFAANGTKHVESIQLAGVSPRAVIFIKSKLVKNN